MKREEQLFSHTNLCFKFYYKPVFFYIPCCWSSWCNSLFRSRQRCCVWAGCYVLYWVILSHVRKRLDSFLVILWQRSIKQFLCTGVFSRNKGLIFSHCQSHNDCYGISLNILLWCIHSSEQIIREIIHKVSPGPIFPFFPFVKCNGNNHSVSCIHLKCRYFCRIHVQSILWCLSYILKTNGSKLTQLRSI